MAHLSSQLFLQAEFLWIPHPIHGYITGKFIQEDYGGTSYCQTEDGEVRDAFNLFLFILQ
jgi:hypothetical protein